MKLFSYVVARDFGFAPNPFFGICTLATCKPGIRSTAAVGDWIIGTGAKTRYDLAGRLIYAMQVAEVLDFDSYWTDPRFERKRPLLNGSLKQMYGDNIYHREGGRWKQADSHHAWPDGRQNANNLRRDTSANRVLIATRFAYFGQSAVPIPAHVRRSDLSGKHLCAIRGYRKLSDHEAVAVEKWLVNMGSWGLVDFPLEFSRHQRLHKR